RVVERGGSVIGEGKAGVRLIAGLVQDGDADGVQPQGQIGEGEGEVAGGVPGGGLDVVAAAEAVVVRVKFNEGDVVDAAIVADGADQGIVGGGWHAAVQEAGVAQAQAGKSRRSRISKPRCDLHVIHADDKLATVIGFGNAQPDRLAGKAQ